MLTETVMLVSLMAAQILPFSSPAASTASPIAFFLRFGAAHRKLAELHAVDDLPARHVVIEASRLRHQRELLTALGDSGTHLVLDTEAAELAAPARSAGHSRLAPWAPADGKVLGPETFIGFRLKKTCGQIARMAVEHGFHAVLSPSHFLGDPRYTDWLAVDRGSFLVLRGALDREGGQDIATDFQVILPNSMLSDASARAAIKQVVSGIPAESIWVRSSGYGADAAPLAVTRYLAAVADFHSCDKPIIADHLGGLAGEAALSLGVISAVSHGVGEQERFDARGWDKEPDPPEEGGRFGSATRVAIPGLFRSVNLREIEVLASARGGRRLCACNDRACCAHGFVDMVKDPRGHMARHLATSLSAMEAVPDLRRATHFLNGSMANADRKGREIKALRPLAAEAAKLGVDGDGLKRLSKHSHRLERLRASLEHIHDTRGDEASRARAVRSRPEQRATRNINEPQDRGDASLHR
jgi:hypothetical protein